MTNSRISIYRWEGGLFNAVCAIYFVTLGPKVVEAADHAMRTPESKVIWLGILLIAIAFAEIFAFPLKLRFVREAARGFGDSTGTGFLLWMFHAVISIILLFLSAAAFGVPITDTSEAGMPWWLSLLIPIVVIKELVFLGFLMWDKAEDDEPPPDPNPKYQRPNSREWILDLILLVYACVTYSATWGAITLNLSMEKNDPVMFTVNLFVSSLLFLIFYLPLRIPYWVEELAQIKTSTDSIKLIASLLLVLIPTIVRLG